MLNIERLLLRAKSPTSCSRLPAAPRHTHMVVETAQRKQSQLHSPMPSVLESRLIQEGDEVVCVRYLPLSTGAVLRPHFPQKGLQLARQWPAREQLVPKVDVLEPSPGNQDAVALLQAPPEIIPRFECQAPAALDRLVQ
jgi:hypothetical protein